jgi:anthranilate phosphoribosyltransferase
MKEYINKLKAGLNLEKEEAFDVMQKILEDASDLDIYDFLLEMNKKEIGIEELVGFVQGMKKKAIKIHPEVNLLVDTCGTGCDNKNTINVSTGAAIVAASAGIPIAKHGNYSITSKCGSADVLEALGCNIKLEPEYCKEMIEEVGFAFLFAPNFHPAMKRVAPIRKKIKDEHNQGTIFNLLGPLCNPANPTAQLLGVYDEKLCEKFIYVLKELKVKRALVVYGNGLDEISNISDTKVYELNNNKITSYKLKPEDFGLRRYSLEDIKGSLPKDNAKELKELFNGKQGAKRDFLLLNSGAILYASGKCKSIYDGIEMAKELIDSGKTFKKFEEIVEKSLSFD